MCVIVVFTITATLGGFGLWDYNAARKRMKTDLHEQAKMLAERLALSFVHIVWDYDHKLAESVILSEMKEKSVLGIFVGEEGESKTLYGGWRSRDGGILKASAPLLDNNFVEREQVILRKNKPIGTVRVFLTQRYLQESLNASMKTIVNQFVLLVFVMVLLLLVLIRKSLIIPLSELRNAMIGIREGKLNQKVEVKSEDEIGQIAESFNIMAKELKLREETLHRYKHIVSATSDLMSFVDRNYIYQAVNQSYLEYHDNRYEEIIGHSVADLHGIDIFNDVIKKEVDKCLSGQEITYQVWIDYAGRGRRFMDVIYNPYTDELGSISGVVVNARDITSQKMVQEALQESEEKYRLLFDSADILVSVYDREGVIQLMNRKLANLFDGEPEDFIGKSFEELQPTVAKEYKQRIRHAIDTGSSIEYEDEVEFPKGIRWLLSRVHPVSDTQDVFNKAQIICQDITERKRTEEELKAYREHLEELVEDRTSQLENEIEVRKKAEQQIAVSLGEKEVLLREIHHRVKNNLNTVSNLLYLQSRTIADSRITTAFQESRNRIQTMARVHELLYRSESLAQIDMDDYLKELAADLAEAYPHRSAVLDTSASGVKLEIDRAIPCGLIVTELVSNSLKYAFGTDSPGDRISVQLSQDGDDYRLLVADNGSGLPDGLNIEKASSLGLRLVGMLTRQLHGSFESLDSSGPGTRFSVLFKAT